MTDFENALIAAHKAYPDYLPLLFIMGDMGFKTFYQIFGMTAGNTNLYDDNGKVFHYINHPAFKATLQYLNKLYREGLIPAEMLTYKFEQQQAVFNAGKVFAEAVYVGSEESDNAIYKANKINGVWKALPTMITDKVAFVDDSVGWAGMFITKKCKDPARAIQFLQFMKSDEGQRLSSWGVEGAMYTLDKDKYPVLTPSFAAIKNAPDALQKFGFGAWGFCTSGKWDGILSYSTNSATTVRLLQEWKKIYQFKPWFQFLVPAANTDQSTIYTKLNQLASDSEISLVVQKTEADFNAKFNDMIKSAEDMGMLDLEKSMTTQYTQVIKRYQN
jgi:putative aldouronate transport system substrate-binding protein